jgi:hypothetical protein
MGVDELVDENAFDPKRLFDSKDYSTVIVNRDGFTNKDNEVANLMSEIVECSKQTIDTFDAFAKLKTLNAASEMVKILGQSGDADDLGRLVAICWESGVDFSTYMTFFSALVCHPDYSVAMEALTVIEESEGPFKKEDLDGAMKVATEASTSNVGLVEDLVAILKNRYNF